MSALQPAQPRFGGGLFPIPPGVVPGFQASGVASVAGILPPGTKQYIINNKSTFWVHFYIGQAVRPATANDLGVPPGTQQVYTRQEDEINYAFISPDGVGAFQITPCEGWS